MKSGTRGANGITPAGASRSSIEEVPPDLQEDLWPLAKRYIWWQPPETSLADYFRLLAHIMNLATWEDQQWLENHVPRPHLLTALESAPAGVFNRRSWNYWHVRLQVPAKPFPIKRIPE